MPKCHVCLLLGHFTNQDTFFCPKGVRIREIPLYNKLLLYEISISFEYLKVCITEAKLWYIHIINTDKVFAPYLQKYSTSVMILTSVL